MKNTKKKLLTGVMVVILMFIMVLPTIVKADDDVPRPGPVDNSELTGYATMILGYVQWIGIVIAIIMLMWYGIRYFTSSPDKQGDLKKAAWGYLIGAACLFGASFIIGFVKKTIEQGTGQT